MGRFRMLRSRIFLTKRSRLRIRRKRRPSRTGRPRILVLCEGTKTEPYYFNSLKMNYRLTSVRVGRPSESTGPRALVKRAKDEIRNDPGWDEVYCVLDHDGRAQELNEVAQQLEALDNRNRSTTFQLVLSVPCFEYWLLLHFEPTSQPFANVLGGVTACDQVIQRLRGHLPKYRKNNTQVFELVAERMCDAIRNAELIQSQSFNGSPCTDVGKLVSRLLRIES